MASNYTKFIDNYIATLSDDETEICTVLDALEKLRSNDDYNLTFSDRFSKLISEKGNLPYSPNATEREKYVSFYRKYLLTLYKEKILPFETDNIEKQKKILGNARKNIDNWLKNDHLPASTNNSRDLLYKICFLLDLSFIETEWFFNHLCFQRCFNLHLKNEMVYYYCFNNALSFEKAIQLIHVLETLEPIDYDNSTNNLFTHQVKDELDIICTDEELIDFYISHFDFVSSKEQNKYAKDQYFEYYNKLKSNDADDNAREIIKDFIDHKRNDLNIEIGDCSPLILEQFENIGCTKGDHRLHITEADFADNANRYNDIQQLYNYFYNQSFSSDSFFLRCLYGSQDIDAEKITFFPSQKTLSNLKKNDLDYTTQYHNLRECLILYYFFYYWLTLKDASPSLSLYKSFTIELNDIMFSCGFETLYSGNAYDQIFLVCSKSLNPIDTFRAFVKQHIEKNNPK